MIRVLKSGKHFDTNCPHWTSTRLEGGHEFREVMYHAQGDIWVLRKIEIITPLRASRHTGETISECNTLFARNWFLTHGIELPDELRGKF